MQTHAAVLKLALFELLSSQEEFTGDTKNLLQGKVFRVGLIELVLSQSKETLLNQSWFPGEGSFLPSEKPCCCAVLGVHCPQVFAWNQFDLSIRVSAV